MGYQGDVREGLVIAHDNVRVTGIADLLSRDDEVPCRIYFRHGNAESPEPPSGPVTHGISVEEANECEEREPYQDQQSDGKPDPE